ncbi:menaquinol-cytochrome c reductase iron-sulfur subunit, partial [Caldalkalibacillus thermarum TA2.A1]
MSQKRNGQKMSRRDFLGTSVKVIGGIAFFSWLGGSVYYAASIIKESELKRASAQTGRGPLVAIGELDQFQQITEPIRVDYEAEIRDGWTTQTRKGFVYVTKDKAGKLLILSPICTHLSCTVPLASEEDRAANPALVFK